MTSSKLRGHDIFLKDESWFYTDNGEPTVGVERPCGHCGKDFTKEGHDGCLGTLPGIMNACCGHGEDKAYVQLLNGNAIYGEDAITVIEMLKRHREKRLNAPKIFIACDRSLGEDKSCVVTFRKIDKDLEVLNVEYLTEVKEGEVL